MSSSVWPYDTFVEPAPPIDNKNIGSITCFVASPVEPKGRWDDLFDLIKDLTAELGKLNGVNIQCYRADHISSSGVIHSEIWKALRTADFIICDVSEQNGNVMLELGIAAACRRKEQVIILRDKNDEKPRLFDIMPARHIEYEISFSGFKKLIYDLNIVISDVLATIPFQEPQSRSITLPFSASLDNGKDFPELYTEDFTHRLMLSDCLEFGAPFHYRYSWMSVGDLKLSKVHVKAEMRMTLSNPNVRPFMGVMIRGQNFFANNGNLIHVTPDGMVYLTVREVDSDKHRDEKIDKISDFNMCHFTSFDIAIDDVFITIKVNNIHPFKKKLSEIPQHLFTAGRVFFIAGHCRVGIRKIAVEEL